MDTTENPKGGFTASVFLGGLPGAEPLGSSDKRAPGSSYVYRVADLLAANIQGGRRVRSKEEPLAAEIVAPTCKIQTQAGLVGAAAVAACAIHELSCCCVLIAGVRHSRTTPR